MKHLKRFNENSKDDFKEDISEISDLFHEIADEFDLHKFPLNCPVYNREGYINYYWIQTDHRGEYTNLNLNIVSHNIWGSDKFDDNMYDFITKLESLGYLIFDPVVFDSEKDPDSRGFRKPYLRYSLLIRLPYQSFSSWIGESLDSSDILDIDDLFFDLKDKYNLRKKKKWNPSNRQKNLDTYIFTSKTELNIIRMEILYKPKSENDWSNFLVDIRGFLNQLRNIGYNVDGTFHGPAGSNDPSSEKYIGIKISGEDDQTVANPDNLWVDKL